MSVCSVAGRSDGSHRAAQHPRGSSTTVPAVHAPDHNPLRLMQQLTKCPHRGHDVRHLRSLAGRGCLQSYTAELWSSQSTSPPRHCTEHQWFSTATDMISEVCSPTVTNKEEQHVTKKIQTQTNMHHIPRQRRCTKTAGIVIVDLSLTRRLKTQSTNCVHRSVAQTRRRRTYDWLRYQARAHSCCCCLTLFSMSFRVPMTVMCGLVGAAGED